MIQKTSRGRRVVAEEEVIDEVVDQGGEVEVAPEATELLFEAEDVAELVAEVTGQSVEVTVNDDDTVDFAVGEDVFTVSADGDEELLEASTRVLKKGVKASSQSRRPVAPARRAVRRVGR